MTAPRFLLPGEYLFGKHPGSVVTLLGSCVAIVLWHPQRRILAVSHFVVPGGAFDQNDTRSGEAVFLLLQQDMVRHRTAPEEYRKGIYGGGTCLQPGRPGSLQIGLKNIAFARERFGQFGWRVDDQQLGGMGYRRLTVDGRDGLLACQSFTPPELLEGTA
ncbi:chemotaxis protein [Stutzerimonas zhaodongensis]|uniref:Chemotaxis protein n=1 Tax=Stutzerimonas zhaodongensis TaxID=1176257 RepID=A0A3M2HSI2_9GAMM|nr:chemotaxis protein CheD [Stutzerimonas zhaodongensis]MCQ4315077.1 chemotaxis protein CheD [Stutzerimonas zhaodongensis]RMH90339.1 chemotaxis protein [Stutzerimonas zhaodongensis]